MSASSVVGFHDRGNRRHIRLQADLLRGAAMSGLGTPAVNPNTLGGIHLGNCSSKDRIILRNYLVAPLAVSYILQASAMVTMGYCLC